MQVDKPLKMKARFKTRRDISGSILFFDCGAAFVLNETAEVIIQGVCQGMTAGGIVVAIKNRYREIPGDQIQQDVLGFLLELEACGAI